MRGSVAKRINKLCSKYKLKRKVVKKRWLSIPDPKEFWLFLSHLEQALIADGRKPKED